MKSTLILMAIVLTWCLIGFFSCDKPGLQVQETATNETTQTSSPVDNGTIETREVSECEDCFEHFDCCCGLEFLSSDGNDNIVLRMCGTAEGTSGMCYYPSPGSCIDPYTGYQTPALDLMSDPKVLFCMENDSVVCITNIEDFDI